MKLNNKRGQIVELSSYLLVLLGIVITVFISFKLGDLMFSGLSNSPINTSDTSDAITAVKNIAQAGDMITLAAIMGMTLLLIITSILVPTNPIFMVFYIIGVSIVWLLTIPISNTYEAMATSVTMSGISASLTVTDTIMMNLPKFGAALVFLILIILFGKRYMLE